MACNRCSSPCQGRHCSQCELELSHEGMEQTAGTERTLQRQREAREDDE